MAKLCQLDAGGDGERKRERERKKERRGQAGEWKGGGGARERQAGLRAAKNADSELRLELPVELISEPGSCASALTVL